MDGSGGASASGRDICVASRRVDRLAPFELAEPWDNVGLQVGSPDAPVAGRPRLARGRRRRARRRRSASAARWCWRITPCSSRRSSASPTARPPVRWRCARRATASPSSSRTPTSTRRAAVSATSSPPCSGSRTCVRSLRRRSTGASSSVSCRRTPPRTCARRSSPPAAAASAPTSTARSRLRDRGRSSPARGRARSSARRAATRPSPSCASRSSSRAACGATCVDAYVAAHPYEEPAFDVYQVDERGREPRARPGRRRSPGRRSSRSSPPRWPPSCTCRRCASAPGPSARCAGSPACRARAPRSSRPPRPPPTSSSPATSSTTRRATRTTWVSASSTCRTTWPRTRRWRAGATRSPTRSARDGVRVEMQRAATPVWATLPGGAPARAAARAAPRPLGGARAATRRDRTRSRHGAGRRTRPAGEP